MTASQVRAVLFCDVCDSSRLYRELGDAVAGTFVRDLIDRLVRLVERAGGRVIDTIGDELMCTLENDLKAAEVAIDLHHEVAQVAAEADAVDHLAVRIGFHMGPVVESSGRIFGQTVYVAKRLVDQASQHQILTTHNFSGPQPVRNVGALRLKGQDSKCELREILWDMADCTEVVMRRPPEQRPEARLLLDVGGSDVTLEMGRSLTLGRSVSCDLTLSGDLVSRVHATLHGRDGYFFLSDRSTNGSFVTTATGGEPLFLQRRESILEGSGLIGLGRAPERDESHTLSFRIVVNTDIHDRRNSASL